MTPGQNFAAAAAIGLEDHPASVRTGDGTPADPTNDEDIWKVDGAMRPDRFFRSRRDWDLTSTLAGEDRRLLLYLL